jgi:hypothetical protein
MPSVGLGDWIRRLFSSNEAEEEAVEREEYGLPDRRDRETERGRLGSFAGSEAADAADDELDEFKAPRDPAP